MTNFEPLTLLQLEELVDSVPSLRLLKKAETLTQKEIWMCIRFQEVLTALYWIGMQEGKGDLLEPLVIAGFITQGKYDCAVRKYEEYLHLWILCVRAEKPVKAECERRNVSYPFNSPYELFLRTVQEQGDYKFSLFLVSYREFSASKYAEASRLRALHLQGETLDADQWKFLDRLSLKTGYHELFWLNLVQKVASKAGKKSHLGRALDYYYRTCAEAAKQSATLLKKGRSVAITKNGLVKGSRHGGKYELIP